MKNKLSKTTLTEQEKILRFKKIFSTLVLFLLCCSLLTMTAFASGTNEYAEKGARWILDGIFWVVVVAGLFGAGMAGIKRNFTAALGIIIGAAVIGVLCKNPEILTTLGNKLKEIIGL